MDTSEEGDLLLANHHDHHDHHHHHNNNNNHSHSPNKLLKNRRTKKSHIPAGSTSSDSSDEEPTANRSPVKPLIKPHVTPVRLLDPLFALLLRLLHLLWAAALDAGQLLRYAYHRLLSRWEAAAYQASLQSLANIPRNVALGINTPQLEVDRLVRLLAWCRQVPTIATVTIYHPYSREDDEAFLKLRERLQKELSSSFSSESQESHHLKSATSKKDFKVALLPFTAGRQSLVQAARYLIANSSGKDSAEDNSIISPEAVSDYLARNHYPHPDPELLLLFGGCRIYNGFPCWQIRLTETVFLPPLRWLTLSQFTQALKVFSKCEQRFGF